MTLDWTTDGGDAPPPPPPVPFRLAGQGWTARRPAEVHVLRAAAGGARRADPRAAAVALLDMLEAALDPAGRQDLRRRLLDPDDPALELPQAVAAADYLLDVWDGRRAAGEDLDA